MTTVTPSTLGPTVLDCLGDGPRTFAAACEPVLNRLRIAFAKLLEGAPSRVDRAADLQRMLDLDTQLGWQIYRLAGVTDPFSAVQFIPGPGSVARVLRVARLRGFGVEAVEAAEGAHAEFLRLVDQHAGDRRSFDAMIADFAGDPADAFDLKDRKARFRSDVRVWGFQAKAVYKCALYRPTTKSEPEDVATVFGNVSLRQLRHLASVPFGRGGATLQTNFTNFTPVEGVESGLLEEFCTKPVPTFSATPDGSVFRHALRLSGVGLTTGVDCFMLSVQRSTPRVDSPEIARTRRGLAVPLVTPCEVLVQDLIVPRGWADPTTVESITYGSPGNFDAAASRDDEFRMPFKENAVLLGSTIECLHDAAVPRCPEMMKHAVELLGWHDGDFEIFRCRVQYPILHTLLYLGVSEKLSE